MRSRAARAIADSVAAALLIARAVPAQADSASAHWEIGAGVRAGVPAGWVQVRENAIAGTRLALAGDLNVRALWAANVDLDYLPDRRTRLSLSVTSLSLTGETTLAHDVYFNGATLAAGTVLATRTGFTSFVDAALSGTRRIAALWGGELGATAGLSFVALTFVLHGTLAPGSATRETQEDFVTQELPVPLVGLEYRGALARRLRLGVRASAAYLPWVNSLRQEGGTVTVTQTEAQLRAQLKYELSASIACTAELRLTSFAQHEESREDGNAIAMRAATIGLGLARQF